MDKAIGIVSGFVPFWTETIQEIRGDYEESKHAILGSARQVLVMRAQQNRRADLKPTENRSGDNRP